MSRKSARLLSKTKLRTHDSESDIVSTKRQKIEIDQRVYSVSGNQQFRIETQLLPISRACIVPTSVIVPSNMAVSIQSDEVDSLACAETLPLPQPTCSGDNSKNKEEEEVVHITTTTPEATPRHFYRFSNHFRQMQEPLRPILPQMNWADPREVWDVLDKKEEKYPRSPDMLKGHPNIKPHMRPVLYTWLTEVCEMYKLHKETYYLAVEYADRYLHLTDNIKPCHLQLMGVTALFMASKVEEIYPPKVHDFAYVCDGAFDEPTILSFELDMIKKLKWLLSPLTPHMWVQIFLQVHHIQGLARQKASASQPQNSGRKCPTASTPTGPDKDCDPLMKLASCAVASFSYRTSCEEASDVNTSTCESHSDESYTRRDSDTDTCDEDGVLARVSEEDVLREEDEDFNIMYPMYSPHQYLQICQLLDSAILDEHSLKFRYKVIAAAALYVCVKVTDITKVTGLAWSEVEQCILWIQIHQDVIRKQDPQPVTLRAFDGIREWDAHLIQCNVITKQIWEKAVEEADKAFTSQSSLMDLAEACSRDLQELERREASSFITPPRSSKKSSPP